MVTCWPAPVPEPIVDAAAKKALLEADGTPLSAALAVGDGANDIPMIQAASAAGGLGIAYHAKPKAAAAAPGPCSPWRSHRAAARPGLSPRRLG